MKLLFSNRVQSYSFFLTYANKKAIKIIYILRIYRLFHAFLRYPMVILWLCYGYPMVRDALGFDKSSGWSA